ncbi:MAG: hypothetical protein US57_C0002G0049 [Candidatus Moranbacteria bacterium GW2011_GWC2_37_73]|nr:MAG: hypothetical protein UR95_C0002G0147 [Parcubacteria group bacterium GW2011_GWC1_36_108]KKQ01010.1 MAG: hypothetical protein US09_C0003G0010 [Candidatus Moranbacteria bacterium GW2011_GWD1_36_198]KKQ02412.1 MAG: hypothetical protein US10_C0001G0010 [Candidatus Moranbacteria bacterium GW2011_GWD2_36_198]KKQ40342.1 MAG: hypothetical protein US57_C0002G0049 [Candidatus Moranbacteria bacterium GW2011_GWC2_37_73]HAS00150.1 hypothetical protein [Candidatus Moranbacteria bacterium]
MSDEKSQKEYDFEATLLFIVDNREVLLAPKLDKIGKDRWNGSGGKPKPQDSSLEECVARETWEELWILVRKKYLEKVAVGYFTNIQEDGGSVIWKVTVYIIEKKYCIGTPASTKEMGNPQWFDMDNMPYMIAADCFWVPEIFKGRKIIVRATMKNNQSELVGPVQIVDVDSFE